MRCFPGEDAVAADPGFRGHAGACAGDELVAPLVARVGGGVVVAGPALPGSWKRKFAAGLATGTAMTGVICGTAAEALEMGGRKRCE